MVPEMTVVHDISNLVVLSRSDAGHSPAWTRNKKRPLPVSKKMIPDSSETKYWGQRKDGKSSCWSYGTR
jgi:hypothetical protein